MDIFSTILAGGNGTRFWPLSRQNAPKQVLNLSGKDYMINETIRRCEKLIDIDKTFIVTTKSQKDKIFEVIKDKAVRAIIEPCQKNTAPCILLAALRLKHMYGDGVMCVLSSDHYITKPDEFQKVLNYAIEVARKTASLITIGISPTFAATGYGYIRLDGDPVPNCANKATAFAEKPNLEMAQKYIEDGKHLWNSGMFVWRVSTILEEFKRFLPKMYNELLSWYEHIGTELEHPILEKIYPQLQSISIDVGIMERAENVMVIPADIGWSDIGSWDSLGAVFPLDENQNIVRGTHIGIDTSNCVIHSDTALISTIGLNDMIVVNCKGAVLVCPKNRTQDVKRIVDILSQAGMEEYV